MSQVVSFAPQPQDPDAAQRRLGAASRALSLLFAGLTALTLAINLALIGGMLAYAGDRMQICPTGGWIGLGEAAAPAGCVPFGGLPLVQKLAYVLVAIVRVAPWLMILWSLKALFALYGEGVIFSSRNSGHLKRIGGWLVALAFAPFACHLFLSLSGLEIDRRWLHLDSLKELILGLLVFVIAHVMQAGQALEEEQKGFV